MKTSFIAVFCISLLHSQSMVRIKGGVYTPLFGGLEKNVTVSDFYMDTHPVTVEEFREFVTANPAWRRSNVKRIYADKMYLSGWESDTNYGGAYAPNSPVTEVSWFAAKAFANWKGKRLPTTDEWEYVAMASADALDARKDSLFNVYILSWYEKPNTYRNQTGKTMTNAWGVADLHGLVWEWVFDFNSIIMTGESRSDSALDRNLFCAAGSVGATDLMNYAAFMRYAFRGSIKARYSMKNLGFRCAKDAEDVL